MPPIKFSSGESPPLIVNRLVWSTPEFLAELDEIILEGLRSNKTSNQMLEDLKAKYAEPLAPMMEIAKNGDPVSSALAGVIIKDVNSDEYASSAMLNYVPYIAERYGYDKPRSLDRKSGKNRRKWKPLLKRSGR